MIECCDPSHGSFPGIPGQESSLGDHAGVRAHFYAYVTSLSSSIKMVFTKCQTPRCFLSVSSAVAAVLSSVLYPCSNVWVSEACSRRSKRSQRAALHLLWDYGWHLLIPVLLFLPLPSADKLSHALPVLLPGSNTFPLPIPQDNFSVLHPGQDSQSVLHYAFPIWN